MTQIACHFGKVRLIKYITEYWFGESEVKNTGFLVCIFHSSCSTCSFHQVRLNIVFQFVSMWMVHAVG